jgi:hypothetical protein
MLGDSSDDHGTNLPAFRLHRNRNSGDDPGIGVFGHRNLVERAFAWKELSC